MTTPSKNTQNIESWATPFRKVLDLEVANGYSNKAVVGGLDRFVLHWIEPMAEFLDDPNLAKLLLDTPYAELLEEARAGWVYQWQSRLELGGLRRYNHKANSGLVEKSAR